MSIPFAALARRKAYDVHQALGVDATFSPIAGDDVECRVILRNDTGYQPVATGRSATTSTIEYLRAEIDRKVKEGETFTIEGESYTVRAMDSYDEGSWTDYEGRAVVVPS